MSLRVPLARVLGRGSARHGVHEWWLQRLTSIALVPLGIGFAVSLAGLPALDYVTLAGWLKQPLAAFGMVLLVLVAARHSQLGLRVIVEDYVYSSGSKTVLLVLNDFAHVVATLAGVFAIVKVALREHL